MLKLHELRAKIKDGKPCIGTGAVGSRNLVGGRDAQVLYLGVATTAESRVVPTIEACDGSSGKAWPDPTDGNSIVQWSRSSSTSYGRIIVWEQLDSGR